MPYYELLNMMDIFILLFLYWKLLQLLESTSCRAALGQVCLPIADWVHEKNSQGAVHNTKNNKLPYIWIEYIKK